MLYRLRLWIEVVQVEGVRGVWKVLSSSQDGQAACVWVEGTKRRTQEIGLQKQTRPNGMGRRLQGGDRWATAVRGWLISATTIGTDAGTVLIKYCQYNNRAMNESNRIAHREGSYQGCKGMCKGSAHTNSRPKGLETCNTQNDTQRSGQRNATLRNATHLSHHTIIHNT